MTKEFVPYTEALALKELGFDEPCFGYYNGQGNYIREEGKLNSNCSKPGMNSRYCTAPTFSQAFRWFGEKHGFENFKTYEEAELECLIKLIEIVKTK